MSDDAPLPHGGAAPARCPKDAEPMQRVNVAGVSLDRCPACHAVWFDALELDKVLAARGSAASIDAVAGPGDTPGKPRPCPRCGSALIEQRHIRQRHVVMLGCTTCGGVLLDAGELRDLGTHTPIELLREYFNRA